jgi:putative phosphoesterase
VIAMRVAVISDIHGNLTALEAIIADLSIVAPDLVLHGGDLASGGSRPHEVVDRVRDLRWPGIVGNADEFLFRAESLEEFAAPHPQLSAMWDAVRAMGARDRDLMGADRLAWLSTLPMSVIGESFAVVHASPESCWRSPGAQAADADLIAAYGPLEKPLVAFGHIHVPFIRQTERLTVVNTGSVSLSYDGDPRASYLLIDNGTPVIRRVEYDVDREIRDLAGTPHADWTIRMLRDARPVPL